MLGTWFYERPYRTDSNVLFHRLQTNVLIVTRFSVNVKPNRVSEFAPPYLNKLLAFSLCNVLTLVLVKGHSP